MVVAGRWLLFVVGCLLFAVCLLLVVVRCFVFVVCYLFVVVVVFEVGDIDVIIDVVVVDVNVVGVGGLWLDDGCAMLVEYRLPRVGC